MVDHDEELASIRIWSYGDGSTGEIKRWKSKSATFKDRITSVLLLDVDLEERYDIRIGYISSRRGQR